VSQPQESVISLNSASKWFPSKRHAALHALKGVSLEVKQGEVIVLLGPSGSGKSTLLRCINLLTVPDEGSLRVGSVNWTAGSSTNGFLSQGRQKRTLLRLRREVGMVFQHFNLFPHMTAVDNVMCGLIHARGMKREEARAIAETELRRVGLGDRMANYPSQLSGGQKQRVAIARAIAAKPVAMLFDEPTSALDPELRGSVLSAMQDLAAEGMTMVVVTHEMGFARAVGHRVVFMDHGEAIEEGDARDFLSNPRTDRAKKFLQDIH
jgi:ABC-type polar amino acid transport system ATPase subunit